MPVLKNPKHERFAQELAKGISASQAYVNAGYKPHHDNPSRLRGDEGIQARVTELQQRASKSVDITIASLTKMYLEDRKLATELGQASAAKGCLDSLAKLHGLMIERKETGAPGEFSRMSDDELDQYISEREDSARHGSAGEEYPQESEDVRGQLH
jgi:phage terminase small subunit